MKSWQDRLEMAHIRLTDAADWMKQWADRHKQEVDSKMGDLVLHKLGKEKFKPPTDMASALVQRFDGLLKVLEKIDEVTYRLELSLHMKTHHLVFHVSQLNLCDVSIDGDKTNQEASSQAPALIANRPELVVDEVLTHEALFFSKNRRHEYFVQWKGQPEEENSWER
jgi:hypothetical protein